MKSVYGIIPVAEVTEVKCTPALTLPVKFTHSLF